MQRLNLTILWVSIFLFAAENLSNQGVNAESKCQKRTDKDSTCKRGCNSDEDCRNRKNRVKKCLCDGVCGLSCIRVGSKCSKESAPVTILRRGFVFFNGKTYKDQDSFEFRDELTYKCKNGFTLSGPSKVVCSGVGKWKPLDQGKPVCRKECKKPKAPKDGRSTGKSYEVGKVVRFRCNPGYQRQGPVAITCLPSLRWNARPPKCKPFKQDYSLCGKGGYGVSEARIFGGKKATNIGGTQWPWQVAIFRAIGKGFTYICGGSLVRKDIVLTAAHCIVNYPQGDKLLPETSFRIVVGEIKLKLENEWLNSKFIQVKRIFTLPSYQPTRALESDIAIMQLMKPVEWSAEIRPVCLPSPQQNHKINYKQWGFVSGFGVFSDASKMSEDLRYVSLQVQSKDDPFCGIKSKGDKFCAGIPKSKNDSCQGDSGGPFVINLAEDKNKEIYSFHLMGIVSSGPYCGDNEDFFGHYTKVTTHLLWINKKMAEIERKASCIDPGSPRNGRKETDVQNGYAEGDTISFLCNPGYYMIGSKIITCQRRKVEWSHDIPQCKPKNCGKPDIPEYGSLEKGSSNFYFPSVVKFTCSNNYIRKGPESLRCGADGKWNGPSTTCIARCRDPGSPENGRKETVVRNGYTEDDSINFLCNTGYDMIGSKTITCERHNADWSHDIPQCKPKNCGKPDIPEYGSLEKDRSNFYFPSVVKFTCNDNYIRKGPESLRCGADGKWNGPSPTCIASCRDPGSPENGRKETVVQNGYVEGDTINFLCNPGYHMIGSKTITCQKQRADWSHGIPQCKQKEIEREKGDKNLESLGKTCGSKQSSGSKWHVLLYRTDESMIFCQGALIDANWVLTIAHCLVGYDGSIMKPGVIEVMIKGSKKHLKVTKIYIHESFKYETFSNDAALLKVEPHSQAATPICLPSAAISGTQTLSLVWWEGDSLDISQPGKVFKGETKAVHIGDCKKKILQAAISYSFDNMQVCSENPDYCDADLWQRLSTASVLVTRQGSRETLVGLKSWGSTFFSCEAGSETQVHMDVFKHLDWISKVLFT